LVHPGGHFIDDLAQGIDVRGGGPWAFGWQVPWGTDAGEGGIGGGDETDVGEFGNALDEDDVGRLDVAVDEVFAMEDGEAAGEFEGELDAFGGGQSAASLDHFSEREGHVPIGVDGGAGFGVIGRLHDVVEVAGVVVAADMEERELARATGDGGLEAANAFEFAEVRAIVLEPAALDDFDDAKDAGDAAGEPDIPVASATDASEERVIGDFGRRCGVQGGVSLPGGGVRHPGRFVC
jgi:hypothetical protein